MHVYYLSVNCVHTHSAVIGSGGGGVSRPKSFLEIQQEQESNFSKVTSVVTTPPSGKAPGSKSKGSTQSVSFLSLSLSLCVCVCCSKSHIVHVY